VTSDKLPDVFVTFADATTLREQLVRVVPYLVSLKESPDAVRYVPAVGGAPEADAASQSAEVERLRAELKACDRAWADVAHNASEEIRKLADWQRRAAARLTADAQKCSCVGEDERCPQCCSRHALLDEVRRPAARR